MLCRSTSSSGYNGFFPLLPQCKTVLRQRREHGWKMPVHLTKVGQNVRFAESENPHFIAVCSNPPMYLSGNASDKNHCNSLMPAEIDKLT